MASYPLTDFSRKEAGMVRRMGAAVAAVGMGLLVIAPAQTDSTTAEATTFRFSTDRAVRLATPESPHWSSGAADRRILFKTRVTCDSTYPSVTVGIKGRLERGPLIGPKYLAATSDQTQVIKKGTSATFYTPQIGGAQVSEPGRYNWHGDRPDHCPGPGEHRRRP
ncbi:hypothetical protein [Streptomyces vietnamensis]|uniref:hypothetical protein n=1 Tax=Streptomyces vietnamensis TaxID=362257 RepID=UPI0034124BFF